MKHGKTTNLSAAHSRRKVTLPEMLTESLRKESRYDYHWCSAIKVLSRLASGTGIALMLLLAYLAFKSVMVTFQSQLLLTSLILVSLGFYASESYYERKRKQERLITKLQDHSVAIAPALMLMHGEQAPEVLNAAIRVLKAHLPMLRDNDYSTFNVRQRASLCYLLQSSDSGLVWAGVGALKHVGDEHAIGPLRALVLAGNTSIELRDAVEVSIESILSRAASIRQARTLLRAGAEGQAAPSALLRSSGNAIETAAEQLVRAVK